MNEPPTPPRPALWLQRWPWLWLLLLTAGVYYGSYYRHGINFRDEGGTVTLLAKRLYDGEVPFRDVILGYNVGWFYPIVGLFKLTGVSFVAVRVYCFALSTLAAALGFLTVQKAARHAGAGLGANVLGLIVGVLLIVVPGMTFKNYNPLAVVANTWCLLGFVLAPPATRSALLRVLVGGLVLGATWLVRIDLGTFFTLLWLGTLMARIFERTPVRRQRLLAAITSVAILLGSAFLMHVPVLLDARARGFTEGFVAQYPAFWKSIGLNLQIRATRAAPTPAPSLAKPAASTPAVATTDQATPPVAKAPEKKHSWSGEVLKRTKWSDVQSTEDKKRGDVLGLFLLTYAPFFLLIPLILWAAINWLRAVRHPDGKPATPLAALVLMGGALTIFPQFFFWRPDSPHLSEFGPGYWVATAGACALLGAGRSWKAPARWFALLVALNAALYLWRMAPDRWTGSIAARGNRKTLFEGENGVRIYVHTKEAEWMRAALTLIREHSTAKDYLIAYPYHPSLNVLADRPTYEKNVYVDNATAKPGWDQAAIQRIEKNKPAIIVIGDWAVNGTDQSRFEVWAAPTCEYIRTHYDLAGTFDDREKFQFYVRRKSE